MGVAELAARWRRRGGAAPDEEWAELREEALPELRALMDEFERSELDATEFRSAIDSFAKRHRWWGFRGTSLMFFTQLWKSLPEERLAAALRRALPAPIDDDDAKRKIDEFLVAVDEARERAQSLGNSAPHRGRVASFLTFFWEAQDRERWPILFPNSRDVLIDNGLLTAVDDQAEQYRRYREAMDVLRRELGTGTWGAEMLLWEVGQDGGDPDDVEPGETPPAAVPADLYEELRQQGLYFPEEVVTSAVLSLLTKPFLILSGISGTGKTQLGVVLGRHLERQGASALVEIDPEPPADRELLVRLTEAKLRRGSFRLRVDQTALFGDVRRGGSVHVDVRTPDGVEGRVRVNSIDRSDTTRDVYALYVLAPLGAWLRDHARPGDWLSLRLDEDARSGTLDVTRAAYEETSAPATRHRLVAVRSDWTDPRGLLGFDNPITERYVRTPALDLLLAAADDPDSPYVLVLDEMNLARVEYYFSDVLSAMETREPIALRGGAADAEAIADDDVPPELPLPRNLLIVGTVNIDETTHAFSPKVLDRANVIEFNTVLIDQMLDGTRAAGDRSPFRLADPTVPADWFTSARDRAALRRSAADTPLVAETLTEVHAILERHNRHFGYRVIKEVLEFAGLALELVEGDGDVVARTAMDLQLMQKVLPKLTGGRELDAPLADLLAYALDGQASTTGGSAEVAGIARGRLAGPPLDAAVAFPRAARKLLGMLDRLSHTGFVSFLE